MLAGRVRGRAAPATKNTMDEPDAQRLALGKLRMQLPLGEEQHQGCPHELFERTRTGPNAVADAGQDGERKRRRSSRPARSARMQLFDQTFRCADPFASTSKETGRGRRKQILNVKDLLLPDAH